MEFRPITKDLCSRDLYINVIGPKFEVLREFIGKINLLLDMMGWRGSGCFGLVKRCFEGKLEYVGLYFL